MDWIGVALIFLLAPGLLLLVVVVAGFAWRSFRQPTAAPRKEKDE